MSKTAASTASRLCLVLACAILPAPALAAGFVMFPTVPASTGEKPQSKLWYHDGSYWAVLQGPSGVAFYEKVGSAWQRGTFANAVIQSAGNADVKWNGTNLFVLVYTLTTPRLYKYTYAAATRAWVLETGFPVTLPNPTDSETMVLDQDSSGRLWATAEGGGNVNVYYSTSADQRTWSSTPVVLRSGLLADDISAVVAFGGNKIGVFWSDQVRWEFGFRVHNDGDPPTTWGAVEVVVSGGGISDDHVNLAADSQGRVYAITKDATDRMRVHRRATTGAWTTKTDVLGGTGTRGIIQVAEQDAKVYILYTRWGVTPFRIEYRVADLEALTFGGETIFISDAADMNNVSGMKQPLPKGSLIAVAENSSSAFWNGFGSPPPGGPPPPPPPPPPPADSTVEKRVLAGGDDAEEDSGGSVTLSSGDLEMVIDGSPQRAVGLRFTGMAIPTGARIASAYVQFVADEAQSEPTSLVIRGEAVDNAAAFTTATGSLTARLGSATTAAASWPNLPAWTVGAAGAAQRTPDLSSVIQEIVDRAGWRRGNALALYVTGTGHRTADAFEGGAALAALLHVEYRVNQAPMVLAGPDQTVRLPGDVALDGTVTDDSLTTGVVTTWSRASGPGTVTFADAGAVDTRASFSAAGTYQLQLLASDGLLTARDTVAIVVLPENHPPVVNAGPDRTIVFPSDVALDATVSDDGEPAPPALVTAWRMANGPGTVTFADTQAVGTRASFSAAGTYELELSASDGMLATRDTVVIVVEPPPNQAPVVNAGPDQTIALPGNVALVGTASDDGQQAPLVVTWRRVSGPGTVRFTHWLQLQTEASFSAAGTYQLELSAADGVLTTSDTVAVVVLESLPAVTTLEQRIAAGGDDAEQASTGAVSLTSGDLELVIDGTPHQAVGLRFAGLAIPPGATITRAYVQFVADEAQSEPTSLTIRGEAVDDAAAFTATSGSLTARLGSATASSVSWPNLAAWTAGAAGVDEQTPELKSVIQEIVGRAGWRSGDALALYVTGSGHRTAVAFEGAATNAALLHVEFSSAPSVPPPPVTATLERRIAASADDAEQASTGAVSLTSADLELVIDGTPHQAVGFRFTALAIPAGATITHAYVQLTADEAQSEPTSLTIRGEAADDAAAFTATSGSLTARLASATAASVSWPTLAAWTVGAGAQTPELAGVIQEIVGRAGWRSGSALALYVTGSGHRTAVAFDGDAATAALLHVEYSTAPPNLAPVVSAGPDQTITLPGAAVLDGTSSDDARPEPALLVATWSMASGPGTVRFVNANAVDTRASFTAAGTYLLALSVSDGALTSRDTVAIVVRPAPPAPPPPVVMMNAPDSTAAARPGSSASPWRPGVAPNPVRARGTLSFLTHHAGPVRIEVYDIHGRRVGVALDHPNLAAGEHSIELPTRGHSGAVHAAGMYFYRVFEARKRVVTGRFTIAP